MLVESRVPFPQILSGNFVGFCNNPVSYTFGRDRYAQPSLLNLGLFRIEYIDLPLHYSIRQGHPRVLLLTFIFNEFYHFAWGHHFVWK